MRTEAEAYGEVSASTNGPVRALGLAWWRRRWELTGGGVKAGHGPRRSGEHRRQVVQRVGEDGLVRHRERLMEPDLAPQHLDSCGEVDQAQAQRIELGNAPERATRHGRPQ